MSPADDTRTRIMDEAEALVLRRGYHATSVDSIVERAGVTKGAFFHHFGSKGDLAHTLVERWAERDLSHLERTLERVEDLARGPVQRLLLFVGLLEEAWVGLTEPYAGCLFASYTTEAGLFDEETHEVIRETLLRWRDEVARLMGEAARTRTPALDIDLQDAADALNVVFEGSFILSKMMGDPGLVARQLRQYRSYLELLFAD